MSHDFPSLQNHSRVLVVFVSSLICCSTNCFDFIGAVKICRKIYMNSESANFTNKQPTGDAENSFENVKRHHVYIRRGA